MNEFSSLLERNQHFAASRPAGSLDALGLAEALPHVRALILGCADMRVDPAHLFALTPGEAVVLRNIGGRVTPGLLAQLGMLGRIGQAEAQAPGGSGEFHLIVLHHTDCGIKRLQADPALLANYFQIPADTVATLSIDDPRAAVAYDVATLRATPGLPGSWLLSGLVYDVHSGRLETIVPPAPIKP